MGLAQQWQRSALAYVPAKCRAVAAQLRFDQDQYG
jgi:hypothetical protein